MLTRRGKLTEYLDELKDLGETKEQINDGKGFIHVTDQ